MQEIKDILLLQKREMETRLQEKYVDRKTNINLNNNIIKVIIGPRRAGKSFFAFHFLKKIGNFGYVNFDDEKLIDVRNYDEIINALNSVYNNPKYILFDEIQNIPKWELFINRLQRQGYHMVITGSNSNLLSNELSTHLTGRHSLITIFPFSFKEYLRLEQKKLTSSEIKEKLSDYLVCGGFPEPLVKHVEIKDYLSMLFNSIVYKDIVKRYKIRNVKEIEDLAYYLMSNVANEYSYHSLTKMTSLKSSHTIRKYIGYLEESFILFNLSRFSYKVKEQVSSNKKIYCIDNGFIQAKGFTITPDMGKLYENSVACALKKDEATVGTTIYYWKNQQQEEVDFVIKKGDQIEQLIQVCYNLENVKTKNREIRALIKAGKELRCSNLLIITADKQGCEEVEWFGDKATIQYTSLWQWLLDKQ